MQIGNVLRNSKMQILSLFDTFSKPKASKLKINGKTVNFPSLSGDTGVQIKNGDEAEVYDYISRLPKGSVFYDFGASIGNFALYAAACGLETYAFEPEKMNFEALVTNANANRFSNLRVFKIAVSDGKSADGVLMFNGQSGAGDHAKVLRVNENSVFPSILSKLNAEQTVKTLSLDQIVSQMRLPPPEYMKVDIDGSEVVFIEGAIKTLADSHLKGMIFELYKNNIYYSRIIKDLELNGFKAVREHEIFSYGKKEEGLFNIEFER